MDVDGDLEARKMVDRAVKAVCGTLESPGAGFLRQQTEALTGVCKLDQLPHSAAFGRCPLE